MEQQPGKFDHVRGIRSLEQHVSIYTVGQLEKGTKFTRQGEGEKKEYTIVSDVKENPVRAQDSEGNEINLGGNEQVVVDTSGLTE